MERLLGLESSAPRTRTRSAALALGFAVLFALAFLAGRATRVPPAQLALAWPAAGVVILWLLAARSSLERIVACVVVVVVSGVLNQLTGTEPLGAWLFGLVNLSHGAVGAVLLHRWRPAWLLDEPFLEGLFIIGFRNVVSSFVVLNALLALPQLWRTRRERGAGCPLTVAAGLVVTGALLWLPWPVDFAIVPIVVVVALRCGAQATSVLVALQGVLVVAATVAGNGQFASLDDPQARVVAAQAFVLVLAVVGVVLATLEDARDAALVQSRRDRDQLQDHMEAALLASAHVVVDPDGFVHVDAVNAALVTLTGRPRHALLGVDPRTWFVDDDVEAFRQGVCELTLGRALGWRTQLRLDDAWGGGWVDVALALVDPDLDPSLSLGGSGASSAAITLQMIDVTAQKEAEQALAHAALHDDLTGLANRALWADSLERAAQVVGSERPALAVMFIDVDRFKQVNDIYGHTAGDKLLVAVGQRLRSLRSDSLLVARLGGDEFGLPNRS
ncbi:GGDEF domain-containing protein [Aeromicrobium sp. REDSEA-S32_B7]|uniref:GGDEF domain-containing protein n=1 Tax=Aeromicrobium sp. REDSEA-S32_B7 TaxID=1811526 RepID=UPI000AD01B7B|nr:GGDEF domain-containing protein [Aeromicrobium sp. REDSEA-S32_B7]